MNLPFICIKSVSRFFIFSFSIVFFLLIFAFVHVEHIYAACEPGQTTVRVGLVSACEQYVCSTTNQPVPNWYYGEIRYDCRDNKGHFKGFYTQTEFYNNSQCNPPEATGNLPCPQTCNPSDPNHVTCVSGSYCVGGLSNYCTNPTGENGSYCVSWACGVTCDNTNGCQAVAPGSGFVGPYSDLNSCNAAKVNNQCPGTATTTPIPPTFTPTPVPPTFTPIPTATPVPGGISGTIRCSATGRGYAGGGQACLDPNGSPPYCSGKITSGIDSFGNYLFANPPQTNHNVFVDPNSLTSGNTLASSNPVPASYNSFTGNFSPNPIDFNVNCTGPTPTPTPTGKPPKGTGNCSITSVVSGTDASWLISGRLSGNVNNAKGDFSDGARQENNMRLPCTYDATANESICSGKTSQYSYSTGQTVNTSFSGDFSCTNSYTFGQVSQACNSSASPFNIAVYAFSDPAFDPASWPQYHWTTNSSAGICWASTGDTGYAPNKSSSLAKTPNNTAVLQASSSTCYTHSDCNDNNMCTYDYCIGGHPFGWYCTDPNDSDSCTFFAWPQQGTCSNSATNEKQTCGTATNGGTKFCASGVCKTGAYCNSSGSYITSPDCYDGNICHASACNPPTNANGDPTSGIGTCSNGPKAYASVCETTSSGAHSYCGSTPTVLNGICMNGTTSSSSPKLCRTALDCFDNNTCTDDICQGYSPASADTPETLGSCKNNNKEPATVCQTDSSGNPQKLCSTGTNPIVPKTDPTYIASTCSVDYVACNNVAQQSSDCCGIKNVQGKSCSGSCAQAYFPQGTTNYDSKNPFRVSSDSNPPNAPVEVATTPLANIVVHAQSDDCGYFQTATTDVFGNATLAVPAYKGSGATPTKLNYTVWADVPPSYTFSRGTRRLVLFGSTVYNSNQSISSVDNATFTSVSSQKECSNCSWDSVTATFGFKGQSISGSVFVDPNGNCAQDAGENGYQGATVSLSGPTSQTTTTNASGTYTFFGLPNGNYSVTLTPPQGYFSGGTNPISTSLPPSTVKNFCLTQGFSISGTIFVDDNQNQLKEGGEKGYDGATSTLTITNTQTGARTQLQTANGVYTTGNVLPAGTYTVAYTSMPSSYRPTFPITLPPPTLSVTVGNSCDKGTSNSGTCSNGNLSNVNFGIIKSSPWIQGKGADFRIDTGFIDPLPKDIVASLLGSGQTPGIIFTGDANADFGQGQGSASNFNWVVGGSATTKHPEVFSPKIPGVIRTSYAYVNATIRQTATPTVDLSTACSPANCTLPGNLAGGVYTSSQTVNLNAATFPSDQNYVFVINGDLRINGNVKVPVGATATFIASGNIYVSSNVGVSSVSDTTANVEGFYSADKSFIVESQASSLPCNPDGSPIDKRLNLAGSTVANAALSGYKFDNKRNLCNQTSTYPVVYMTERVDLLLNAPLIIKHPNFVWQEIAP